ncbi:hypothetical protein GCM10020221_03730 [Streptomyces thioluteus]|uniref:DUF397 domain-containing protein n=1 Tax=Streptomyces thioluteus TaxID=66431 RepID=A0ABP6IVM1_STRTU
MQTTVDLPIAAWRKSTHSVNEGGCVEVAEQCSEFLPVRDSKDTGRTPLVFPRPAWSAFVTAVAVTNGDLSA